MDSRSAILGRIRAAAQAGGRDEGRAAAEVAARLATPPVHPTPGRVKGLTALGLMELFTKMATAVGAGVERVADPARVPHAVADYLSGLGQALQVRSAPDPWLRAIPWDRRPSLSVAFGRAQAGDQVGVTTALAGVAETGTLVIPSGSDQATSLLFLPRIHIVILPLHHIVGTYEEAWHGLAIRQQARGLGMPRSVNMVTGPSRTADIEQTSLPHAHGPGRVQVILVGEPDPATA